MQTSEILDKLKALQDVLADKYDIEAKIEELPKSLDGSKALLERTQKEYIEKNAEYEAEKAKVSALQVELDEVVKLRESSEKGMDDIKTHREYEILDKQISDAQEKEDSLRKELQKEDKILSELNDDLQAEESIIESTKNDVAESQSRIDMNLEEYNKQLDELKALEQEKSEGIEDEIVYKFQRIIQKNRKGVVSVHGDVCSGCQMILPSQFVNEIRKGEKILFCPYCSRILFYEESDNSTNYNTLEDIGSLIGLDDDDEYESESDSENDDAYDYQDAGDDSSSTDDE